MLTLLDTAISFVAPHRCLACGVEGSLLCPACLPLLPDIRPQCYQCHRTDRGSVTCQKCRKDSALEKVWIRTSYDGFGEVLIKKLKFERALSAANTVARSLAMQFADEFLDNTVFVPVPTATGRVRQRGYDQSVMTAKALASYTGLPCLLVLERHGQQRQTGSTRKQRLDQLENAFRARKSKVKDITDVILVDDILTTGATFETAARTLKKVGVKHVSALAFARAE